MSIFNLFSKKVGKYEKFLSDCEKAILSYESDRIPSCKNDLIEAVKVMTNDAKPQISSGLIPPQIYDEFINKLLANCSFDLLASGKYHICRGKLNSMSCASNLMSVHNKSIEYALNKGIITRAEKEEDYDYLMECINNVG